MSSLILPPKRGWRFSFHYDLSVDAAGEQADGRKFSDIRELKQLLLSDEKIACNLARQFTVYATDAPVRFADREQIESILERASSSHHGVSGLVHELVKRRVFREN